MKEMDRNSSKRRIIRVNIFLSILLGLMLIYVITIYNKSYKQIINNDGQYYKFSLEKLPINFNNEAKEGKINEKIKENIEEGLEENSNKSNSSISPELNKIAILVANIGTNNKLNELALKLPKKVSIGILPHTKNLDNFLKKITGLEHESYIYLPLELNNHSASLSPWSLLSNLSIEQNIDKLSSMINYIGEAKYNLYTSPDEKLSNSKELLIKVLNYLSNKDILCIWSNPNSAEILQNREKIKFVDIVIDPKPEANVIKNNLRLLLYIAQKNGYAFGYLNGYNISIEMLNQWLPNIGEYNSKLVHVSEILNIKKNEK